MATLDKRPPGRPPTGKARKVPMPALVQPETLAWVDAECQRRGIARGVLIDELVKAARAD